MVHHTNEQFSGTFPRIHKYPKHFDSVSTVKCAHGGIFRSENDNLPAEELVSTVRETFPFLLRNEQVLWILSSSSTGNEGY